MFPTFLAEDSTLSRAEIMELTADGVSGTYSSSFGGSQFFQIFNLAFWAAVWALASSLAYLPFSPEK